jgi:hypothetical protein
MRRVVRCRGYQLSQASRKLCLNLPVLENWNMWGPSLHYIQTDPPCSHGSRQVGVLSVFSFSNCVNQSLYFSLCWTHVFMVLHNIYPVNCFGRTTRLANVSGFALGLCLVSRSISIQFPLCTLLPYKILCAGAAPSRYANFWWKYSTYMFLRWLLRFMDGPDHMMDGSVKNSVLSYSRVRGFPPREAPESTLLVLKHRCDLLL